MSDFIDGVNKYFLIFNSGKSMHCQLYKTKYDLALEDIYSHEDLLNIARCKSKVKLRKWLIENGIPVKTDSQGKFIASRKLIESILGYDYPSEKEPEAKLCPSFSYLTIPSVQYLIGQRFCNALILLNSELIYWTGL